MELWEYAILLEKNMHRCKSDNIALGVFPILKDNDFGWQEERKKITEKFKMKL
jgi:hypothetical protein